MVTSDGYRINIWNLPGTEENGRSVLIACADAGNMGQWLGIGATLCFLGYDVWMFDYRGFGGSQDFATDRDMLYHSEYLRDFGAVLEHVAVLRDRPVDVLAFSMGTIMVGEHLRQYPGRKSLIHSCVMDGFISDPAESVRILNGDNDNDNGSGTGNGSDNGKATNSGSDGKSVRLPATPLLSPGFRPQDISVPMLLIHATEDTVSPAPPGRIHPYRRIFHRAGYISQGALSRPPLPLSHLPSFPPSEGETILGVFCTPSEGGIEQRYRHSTYTAVSGHFHHLPPSEGETFHRIFYTPSEGGIEQRYPHSTYTAVSGHFHHFPPSEGETILVFCTPSEGGIEQRYRHSTYTAVSGYFHHFPPSEGETILGVFCTPSEGGIEQRHRHSTYTAVSGYFHHFPPSEGETILGVFYTPSKGGMILSHVHNYSA